MFLSDHRAELLDHGRFGKSAPHLFAHNTQQNWVLRFPNGPRGVEVDALLQNQDVVPTALDLLSLPPLQVDGVSAWPLVQGQGVRRASIITGWGDFVAVRSADWNYIVNTVEPAGSERLYDLQQDPHEQRNVAAEHPEQISAARQQVEAFLGQALPARYVNSGEAANAPARVYFGAPDPSRPHTQAGFV